MSGIGTFYAIRHKPSGKFLPARNARGQTLTEPGGGPPRLFRSASRARAALTWWLKGVAHGVTTRSASTVIVVDPVKGRSAKDMEIVRVQLLEVLI